MMKNLKHLKTIFFVAVCVLFVFACRQSNQKNKIYRASIVRADGLPIVFNIQEEIKGDSIQWIINNAGEKLLVEDIAVKGDSLLVNLPFFEANLLLLKTNKGYSGTWHKKTSIGEQTVPIIIEEGKERLILADEKPVTDISGRWSVVFTKANGKQINAIAEFKLKGDSLTGTFLTATGDYRYLEGLVKGDSLVLSTFDGTHAYFFSGKISAEGVIENGVFASGPTSVETWTAKRDSAGNIDESAAKMELKGIDNRLHFRFPDLDSNLVGIEDDRYKNKVVVLQIMGSWCPNCMDETAFLSDYYAKNASKGVEVIGLAYEFTTDFSRATKNLMRFKNKFNVQYPMLVTGVTSADTLRTEKTLPEMTPIKAFPSMIFIGKDGTVRKTHAGYAGPATGIHHEAFKQNFNKEIEELLAEKAEKN
ncbi:MAG: hypothetical protein RLZZ595_856 [Bacteroidota bacterium]|jgi:thiol-disulfide isomerase/thioredoxin